MIALEIRIRNISDLVHCEVSKIRYFRIDAQITAMKEFPDIDVHAPAASQPAEGIVALARERIDLAKRCAGCLARDMNDYADPPVELVERWCEWQRRQTDAELGVAADQKHRADLVNELLVRIDDMQRTLQPVARPLEPRHVAVMQTLDKFREVAKALPVDTAGE